MWVLECDGDLFDRRKIWLRPGKHLLFGRTRDYAEGSRNNESRHIHIRNTSVSRKHLMILVSAIRPGDGAKTSKSHLVITDESTVGTYLDGEKFTKESRSLTKDVHEIKLGNWNQVFIIKWQPVILTFTNLEKSGRDAARGLDLFLSKLEQLDVKTIEPYLVDSTTHVVASKRNTAKGLQALVNGRHIVTEAYIDAIADAAASPGTEEDGETPKPAPLEEDFERAWPDPIQYLPDPAKEPNPRPPEYFKPNIQRVSIFEGFTFIFGDPSQHRLLADPISNGGAKCLLYEVDMGLTPVSNFVEYVKNSDSKNGRELFQPGIGRGPVVVRFRSKGDTANWAIEFLKEVDRELGQRSIEQNEFLDAILTNDAGGLRKALEEEPDGIRVLPPTAVSSRVTVPPAQDAAHKPTSNLTIAGEEAANSPYPPDDHQDAPERRTTSQLKSRRTLTKSRFKGFDELEEPRPPRPPTPIEEEAEQSQDGLSNNMEVDSQPLFVTDSQLGNPKPDVKSSTRKRPAPAQLQTEGDTLDDILPGAAAMKKRRLEHGDSFNQKQNDRSTSPQPFAKPFSRPGTGSKNIKKEKEVDFRTATRSYAEDLDRKRLGTYPGVKRSKQRSGRAEDIGESEDDEDNHEGWGVAELRKLAVVEDMDVQPRPRAVQRRRGNRTDNAGNSGDRGAMSGGGGRHERKWNDEWSTRRNFKGFRRRGENVGSRGHKVIVPVEETKLKDYGMGEARWLETGGKGKRGRTGGQEDDEIGITQSQSQSQARAAREEVDDDSQESEAMPEEIAGVHVRETGSQAFGRVASKGTASTRASARKRGADEDVGFSRPAKRLRQSRPAPTIAEEEDDDESSDEDEFKFTRRRR